MALARCVVPALVGGLMWAAQLGAQAPTGTITGRVVDSTTQRPLAGATVRIEGTQRGTITRDDGGFTLSGVPDGTHRVRATRIGYSPQNRELTIAAGGTATASFSLTQTAALLEDVVTTGYGTTRREAVTGSVATVDADAANVGVTTNPTQMIQGRVAGVTMVQNNGEPGAAAQIRIRGGTSISASNEPLYVIDGVPVSTAETEARGIGIGGAPPLPRNPLNFLNPSDIQSITILKDAAAAIYGTRAANGVVLIETKKGAAGRGNLEYDGYVAAGRAARHLDVLNGQEYRQFIQQQVAAGNLAQEQLQGLGSANTNWEDALTRTGVTHNHNLAFSGGTQSTLYRASLNYMDQEGVVLSNGLERIQGRLNANHTTFDDRLRLGLNLTTSRVNNDYLPYENTGGFEGGVFQNVAVFNPTQPVRVTDPATGVTKFYELGSGRQSVRNPVGIAEQVEDFGVTNRTLGNVTAELDLLPGLTGQVNVGADQAEGVRRTYFPLSSPVGAEWEGRALQVRREGTTKTLQTVLSYKNQFFDIHGIDLVGGYEFSDEHRAEFGAEARGFSSDATGFTNLSAGNELLKPFSWEEDSRLVSFFGRANYSYKDRYYLTGVLRRDGSSRFGAGNKWATFPALSASWRISEEAFMQNGPFSDLRLRAGWGIQGNPAVPPYSSLIVLEASGGARYVFGNQAVTGFAPVRNPNPNLKWEQTSQVNVALDFGLMSNRFSGSIEYYVKNTKDLLLEVPVPQPALVATRIENIGKVRNRGLEFSLDALALSRQNLTWRAGLVFAAERNEVVDLGGTSFITTGKLSGQGQSDQVSQRIIPGEPLGTFYGPRFVGVNAEGKQLFRCKTASTSCVNGQTTTPSGDDYEIIGNANPDFTIGLRSQANWRRFDASFLINSMVGQDVVNNTALVYSTKGNAKQGKNFLRSALTDPIGIGEPAIYSSLWVEGASFVRLQNVTVGYTFTLPRIAGPGRDARFYVSGDNLILLTDYSGLDPETHAENGIASRGIDYLSYPHPRTFTTGIRVSF